MGFSIKKDPVGVLEYFLAGINDARLDVRGGVENLSSKVPSWCDDNESSDKKQDKEVDTCGRQKHNLTDPTPTCLDNLRMLGAENRGKIP